MKEGYSLKLVTIDGEQYEISKDQNFELERECARFQEIFQEPAHEYEFANEDLHLINEYGLVTGSVAKARWLLELHKIIASQCKELKLPTDEEYIMTLVSTFY